VGIVEKPLAHNGSHRFNHGRDRGYRSLHQVNAGQRLLNLQRALTPGLGIDVLPIIKAKGDIAVFLDFKYHDAITKRVNDPDLDQNALTAMWREASEAIVDRLLREFTQILRGRASFQTGINAASPSGCEDDPCLRFSSLASRNELQLAIGRMHLHGKHLMHVEKFQKQRKPFEPRRQFAKDQVGGPLH
jgi:hypothetical protein